MYAIDPSIVVLYTDEDESWYFAEIDGRSVIRFGPYPSLELTTELVAVMFADSPLYTLAEPVSHLDDAALVARCIAARRNVVVVRPNTLAPICSLTKRGAAQCSNTKS